MTIEQTDLQKKIDSIFEAVACKAKAEDIDKIRRKFDDANKIEPNSSEEAFSNLVISTINEGDLSFLKLLLNTIKNKDDFNYLSTKSSAGSLPLGCILDQQRKYSLKTNMISLLLKHGADPNEKDQSGESSLHYALRCIGSACSHESKNFYCTATELLLENKDNPNKKANPNVKDKYGRFPLHNAIAKDDYETTKLLLEHEANPNEKDKDGRFPLHNAVIKNDLATIELLLKHGADPNEKDKDGISSLRCAIVNGNHAIAKLLLENKDNPSKKADPNEKDKNDISPLYHAIVKKDLAMIELFLEYGADPNEKSKGISSLHCAIANGNHTIAKLLLENKDNPSKKADPNEKDKDGTSLLYRAVHNKDSAMVELLLDHGAHSNEKDKYGESLLHHVLRSMDHYSFIADESSYYTIVKLLLKQGVNPNEKDKYDKFPLHRTVAYKDGYAITELLLEHNADPNVKENRGKTPLHTLCIEHKYVNREFCKVVKLLVKKGVDLDLKDNNGEKAKDHVSHSSDVGRLLGAIDRDILFFHTAAGTLFLFLSACCITAIIVENTNTANKTAYIFLATMFAAVTLFCFCSMIKDLLKKPLPELIEAREEFLSNQKNVREEPSSDLIEIEEAKIERFDSQERLVITS